MAAGGEQRSALGVASPARVETPAVDPAAIARWLGWFVLLGLLARTIRYAVCFPLWDDESFLCANFIDRGYLELLKPLDFHQVAPVLFLWIEHTAVRLLGYSELALRLVPFVCGLASVLLFRRVASRLLSGLALLLAVAIFAVSYPGIRYSAEAKPYGTDLLVSLVVVWLTLEWIERREARWLWWIACLSPLLVGLSYPAVFALGGASLVVGVRLLQQRRAVEGGRVPTAAEWRALIAWNVVLVASFGFWFLLSGRVQAGAEAEFMGQYWQVNFPPMREPWKLPMWLLRTHASDFLAYPVGGPRWASSATLILVVIGLWHFSRRRNFILLGLCLAPAGLHFLASALQRYPYGGHVKFSQYLAPMICCLAGAGGAQALAWLSARPSLARRSLALACTALAAIGLGVVVRDIALPYKTQSDFRARAWARGFWFGAASAEELACVESDLGLDFVPQRRTELSWSAQYLCNHAIEKSRYKLHAPDFARISHERPLCCVLYHESRFPLDQAKLQGWLADMDQNYELVGHESLSMPRMRQNERTLMAVEFIDSYRFIPRDRSWKARVPASVTERQTAPVRR
jgi:hypothetical protein